MTIMRTAGLLLLGGTAMAFGQGAKPSLQVCVGADKALRVAEGTTCPGGSTRHELVLARNDSALQARVVFLEQALDLMNSTLEAMRLQLAKEQDLPTSDRINARLKVVNRQGGARVTPAERGNKAGF